MLKTLLATVLAVSPVTQLSLPPPTGPEKIGTVSVHLIDRSRPDPWVASEPVRELMAQIWYPARSVRGHQRADWVSPGVAARINPPGTGFALPVTHGYVGAPPAPGRHPVILYSAGLGMERTGSTALVEDLVSHGYVVVTIDHTHDANFVEFPGGRLATTALPTPGSPEEERELLEKILEVRVTDTRFVLGRLRELPLAKTMDLSRVGMFGHSMGGAATAQTMASDRRIRAGINMDGSFLGPVLDGGLDRPLLMLGSETHGEQDETWVRMWGNLRGPRYWLELQGAGHLSFADFQVLLHQIGSPPEQTEPMIGAIDGERSIAVQRAYVRAFFDRHLRLRDGRLLDRPSPRYPEMKHLH